MWQFFKISTLFSCSHELQTCDWPRNVVCVKGKRNGDIGFTNDEDHERVPRILVEDVNYGQKNVVVSENITLDNLQNKTEKAANISVIRNVTIFKTRVSF